MFPVKTIVTIGNGDNATNNFKVKHFITGNIDGSTPINVDAHKFRICQGTNVSIVITDDTGTPTVSALSAGISCTPTGCTIIDIQSKQRYRVRSADRRDKDIMQFFVFEDGGGAPTP